MIAGSLARYQIFVLMVELLAWQVAMEKMSHNPVDVMFQVVGETWAGMRIALVVNPGLPSQKG